MKWGQKGTAKYPEPVAGQSLHSYFGIGSRWRRADAAFHFMTVSVFR
jgi:hypothetical protein